MRRDDTVLRVVSTILIPFIWLFALYVQFHGDFGPGGGFQAGVLFAAAFILYGLVFGLNRLRQRWPVGVLRFGAAFGVMLYIGTGYLGIALGGRFLDYNVLGSTPQGGQHLGILLVELGVLSTVSSVMLLIFYVFATGARAPKQESR